MGELIRDLRAAAAPNGNGHHSTTGNIYGRNGKEPSPQQLVRWDD